MDKRKFWSTKSPRPEYHAIAISHPAIAEPIRLVANQFAPVVLSGFEHTPAPMQIKPPDQGGDTNVRMTLSFPRHVVGQAFKASLKLIQAYAEIDPIAITYSIYLSDTDSPEIVWPLYASDQTGVQFTPDAVQVTATDTNPMRRQAGVIYTPDVFTGLESA